jgi:hypothetical protein
VRSFAFFRRRESAWFSHVPLLVHQQAEIAPGSSVRSYGIGLKLFGWAQQLADIEDQDGWPGSRQQRDRSRCGHGHGYFILVSIPANPRTSCARAMFNSGRRSFRVSTEQNIDDPPAPPDSVSL